jgi:protein-S-isoprenylcysteine O-methyltransferase Ste14
MMKRFILQTKKEYPLRVRLAVTMSAGLVFAVLIPMALLLWASRLDAVLGLRTFIPGIGGWIIGVTLLLTGFGFALWSISDQLFRAQGTPIPVVATQVLLVSGPFRLCRNPMGLGAIMAYLGLAILTGSPASILCAVLFAAFFILYVKCFEEKELEARFGDSYRAYRVSTPFIIPHFMILKKHG